MARGVAAVGADDLYWAARATLISRREDIDAFDRAFAEAFRIPVAHPPPGNRRTAGGASRPPPRSRWTPARRATRAT